MEKMRKPASLVMLVVVLALAGCATAQPVTPQAQPTQDLTLLRTEVAQTVVAEITAEALANPSATPTSAPTETATPLPQPTEPTVVTLTPMPAQPTSTTVVSSGSVSSTVWPTRTATPYTDQAQWVSQSLADGVSLKTGQDFDMKWTVKNTGVRDWNTEFYYRYAGGDLKPSDNDMYFLPRAVEKNDTVEMLVDFVAPSTPGRYTSNWELVNDDGTAFFHFYIVINVR